VAEALGNLFKANGFNVISHYGNSDVSSLSDKRLVIKGRINEFFVHGLPGSIWVMIDIDLTLIDTKYQRTIWTGKIENYQKIRPNRGIFTSTSKITLSFNTFFSDAIKQAWIDYGMLNALKALDKKDFSK